MSTSAALRSARRASQGAAVAVLLALVSVTPVAAWRSASPHAAVEPARSTAAASTPSSVAAAIRAFAAGVPDASAAGAPVESPKQALAAGGRRAPGGKQFTVVRFGIDVSHWQGKVDWDKVARSGKVQFVVAKATEGTWMVDSTYARNRLLAQRSGIWFTAYHYANPSRQPGDARREADFFLKHAGLRGTNLLPALDLEETGDLTPAQLERWTLQWMRRVEKKLGVQPMLYTSPGFWSGWVGDSTQVARAGFTTLWLSHWQVRKPWIPAQSWNGAGWTFWQWTERGLVEGIDGFVDRNVYSGPKLQRMTIRELRREGSPTDPRGERPPRPTPH